MSNDAGGCWCDLELEKLGETDGGLWGLGKGLEFYPKGSKTHVGSFK